MTMTIELSDEQEQALRAKASVQGLSPATFVHEIIGSALGTSQSDVKKPFKSGLGMWRKYNMEPISAEEIDANRADMLRGSIFSNEA